MTSFYILIFTGTAITSLIFTRFVRDEVIRRGWLEKPDSGRHFHVTPIPRLGGIAVFLAFTVATGIALLAAKLLGIAPAVSSHTLFGILLPACLIFILGLLDDIFSIGYHLKFVVQIIAAVWLYWSGLGIYRLTLYSGHATLQLFIGIPLTILWVLLITNGFNLIDGLDGLSAGSALFSTIIIFAVSVFTHTPLVSLLSIVLAGVILGFLRYNFYPASIFLGDSGSLFIGFLLSALALAGSEKATTVVAVAIPVVSFGLPLLDVFLSVFRRYMNNKPLFLGDDDHLHHKLIKRGFSHRDAVLLLYAVAAAFGILSLTLLRGDMMIGFVLLLTGLGVWIGVQQLRYVEVYELAAAARRMWQQKQITANNLQVRRAIESFHNAAPDLAELCRTLQAALGSVGFCGISISFPQVDWADETLLFPLRRDGQGGCSHLWKAQGSLPPQWELKLELTSSSSGSRFGYLCLFRERDSDPLLLDMNLLGDEFRVGVSGAVERALDRVPIARVVREKPQAAVSRVTGAGS